MKNYKHYILHRPVEHSEFKSAFYENIIIAVEVKVFVYN